MFRPVFERVRQHPVIATRPGLRQFVKFSLVGGVNTATSTAVYLSLTRLVDISPLVANALAFIVAVTISFIFNKRWTFRDVGRDHARQYSKFFFISGLGLGWSELIIWWLHHLLGWPDLVAFFTAVVVVVGWNFTLNRWWTFRPT